MTQEDGRAEEKRYKAYLTRLSKYLAFELADKTRGVVGIKPLRRMLVARGELEQQLDDAWAARVFSDKDLFTGNGDGFWQVAELPPDDRPGEPSKWEGIRPGEDVAGDAVHRAVGRVRMVDQPNWKSRWLEGPAWEAVSRSVVDAMGYAKSRGLEKPLADMQERSLRDSCLDSEPAVQTVALWLLNTGALLDVYARVQAALREGQAIAEHELALFMPSSWVGETPPKTTPEAVFKNVRRHLVDRGILSGKKGQ